MIHSGNNNRYLAFSGLAFLACVVVCGGLVYGLIQRAQTAQEAQLEAEKIAAQKSQRAETATSRDILNNFFVAENGVAEFISQVETIADNTQVSAEIANITIKNGGDAKSQDSRSDGDNGTDDETPLTETLTLQIRSTGSWTQVTHFIRTLEQYPVLGNITELALNREVETGPDVSTGPRWNANFTYQVLKLQPQ